MLWDTIVFWTVDHVGMSSKAFWHCSFIWPLLFSLFDPSPYIKYDIILPSFCYVWIVSIHCIVSSLTLAFLFDQIWAMRNLLRVELWSFLASLRRYIHPVASLTSLPNGIWVQSKCLHFNILKVLLLSLWSTWHLTSCGRPLCIFEQFLDFFIC